MKLLKVIIISISVWLISINVNSKDLPGEANELLGTLPDPVWIDDPQMNFPNFLFRYSQYLGMKLKKEEKVQHQGAVFYMLNNAKNGELVSWYSDIRLAVGKVRVIHTYPISGGYCRTYQAFIKINAQQKHMTNNACKYIGAQTWVFYK
tara:strand:+ start:2509 stop:2955 length:447 start_codon:yes stop_codon:yes gene_type:complete